MQLFLNLQTKLYINYKDHKSSNLIYLEQNYLINRSRGQHRILNDC